MGDVEQALGDISSAERSFRAAVTLDPEDATAHARLGILLATWPASLDLERPENRFL
jgi:Flp pilus assembly protein TadD